MPDTLGVDVADVDDIQFVDARLDDAFLVSCFGNPCGGGVLVEGDLVAEGVLGARPQAVDDAALLVAFQVAQDGAGAFLGDDGPEGDCGEAVVAELGDGAVGGDVGGDDVVGDVLVPPGAQVDAAEDGL